MSPVLCIYCILVTASIVANVAASHSCVCEHKETYVPGIEDHVGTTGRTEGASAAFKRVWMGLRHRAGGNVAVFSMFLRRMYRAESVDKNVDTQYREKGLRCIFRGIFFCGYRAIFI